MAVHHYPVLIWRDVSGIFSAAWIEDADEMAAVSRSKEKSLRDLRSYLNWRLENYPWSAEPDFENPQALWIAVKVRPEYREDDRVYPCSREVSLRIPCVRGNRRAGIYMCSLPTLGVSFHYHDPSMLKHLVQHYVQFQMQGLTPMQVSRYLPPEYIELDDLVVRNRKSKATEFESYEDVENLIAVAEKLGRKSYLKSFSRCWQRDDEIRDLQGRIEDETSSLVIVGEPGVGKSTLIAETIRRIERSGPKSSSQTARFWLTSASRLISGMKYLGQWEERCESLIDELSQFDGILCVESLIELARQGGQGPADSLAAFFLPFLASGELRLVSEATPAELDALRQISPGFADIFQTLHLEAFEQNKALEVLDQQVENLQQNTMLRAEEKVADTVYRLHKRFLPYEGFPGKSVSFLDDLFQLEKQKPRKKTSEAEVRINDVRKLFSDRTGLPELLIRDDRTLDRDETVGALECRVIGQGAACQTAADFILTFKAGMNDPNRPLGVLLFCGPTGVGKTELAKSIAQFLFGGGKEQESRLVRLDMSEFVGPYASQRFLGQPGGEPSEMVKKIRRQPFCVMLLDEIEKADPQVFDLLLRLFDEGVLTDTYGRATHFKSCVIIMTSNLGSDSTEPPGFLADFIPTAAAEIAKFFRPEFFNRLDTVVEFEPLRQEVIEEITEKELREISLREGFAATNLKLTWSRDALQLLARKGYDLRYGARPLQRALEEHVITPLSILLLGNPQTLDRTVHVDLNSQGQLTVCLIEENS